MMKVMRQALHFIYSVTATCFKRDGSKWEVESFEENKFTPSP